VTSPPLDLTPLDVPAGPSVATPLPPDRPVRWGILATGTIATNFVRNLALLEECEVSAVGARRQESAEAFAAEHGIPTAYGDYRALVEDPSVDVVYVATPHALHREHAELALEAGKPVLCEKAMTLTGADTEHLVRLARERGLFLMEAMWMRCHPVIRRLRQLVDSGALGEVRQLHADIGFLADRPPTDRLLDPAMGGGALLDMGVYPLTFASLFLGEPATLQPVATLSESGIDLDIAVALGYPSGATATISATLTGYPPRSGWLATDRGRVDLAPAFYSARSFTWTPFDADTGPGGAAKGPGEPVEVREEVIGTGLAHEALEVVRCLRAGEIESPLVPLDDTLALMRQMDRIRAAVGVRYPNE
jgi:predicted dehydrogenase